MQHYPVCTIRMIESKYLTRQHLWMALAIGSLHIIIVAVCALWHITWYKKNLTLSKRLPQLASSCLALSWIASDHLLYSIPSLKMGLLHYLDAILVPLSIFILFGYHGFLWNICKKKSNLTTLKINKIRRRSWVLSITEDPNDKKLMFSVQTLRNTQMVIVLTATIAIVINSSLAAYTNNAYKANHLLKDSYFGLQSSTIIILKYGSASLFLLSGFLCNSVAIGCLSEANILAAVSSLPTGYVQGMMERGFMFTFIGNRMLYITVPLLLWLFGPVPMALSSIIMVWVLYNIDFASCGLKQQLPQSSMTHTID